MDQVGHEQGNTCQHEKEKCAGKKPYLNGHLITIFCDSDQSCHMSNHSLSNDVFF